MRNIFDRIRSSVEYCEGGSMNWYVFTFSIYLLIDLEAGHLCLKFDILKTKQSVVFLMMQLTIMDCIQVPTSPPHIIMHF